MKGEADLHWKAFARFSLESLNQKVPATLGYDWTLGSNTSQGKKCRDQKRLSSETFTNNLSKFGFSFSVAIASLALT